MKVHIYGIKNNIKIRLIIFENKIYNEISFNKGNLFLYLETFFIIPGSYAKYYAKKILCKICINL